MSENSDKLNITKEVAAELARDVYSDAGKPAMKATGELVGLVPRAIKAALAPVEKWVLQKEYNVAKTRKLLEDKLKDVSPELIEVPDAHIAVPALQYISYCMDNDELRNMYANLLANSMNRVAKNGVHPGFVEIIKQLCPDEAKIMKYFYSHTIVPTITLRYSDDNDGEADIVKNFSNIGELAGCEQPFEINKYFDNLTRLGLLESSTGLLSLADKTQYEPLKRHKLIISAENDLDHYRPHFNKTRFVEGYVRISDYGKAFCSICLDQER